MSFFNELKRRNVFRVGAAYLVVAWLLIQIVDTLSDMLTMPDAFGRGVLILLAIGFPIVMVVSWIFELTPEGIQTQGEADEAGYKTSTNKLNAVLFGAMALVIVMLVVDNYVLVDIDDSAGQAIAEDSADVPFQGEITQTGNLEKSIAVLPFANLSSDPEQEYFSDGLSEELLNNLAQVQDLLVAARTSSFYYKGRNEDMRTIGDELGVNFILEGSVRKSNNQLRITAQLIQANNGFHLWSDTYDRELVDIFAIQDEIATEVTRALSITLAAGEFDIPGGTQNVAAYDAFLRARSEVFQFTPQSILRAIDYLEEAVELDPDCFPCWSLLGAAYSQDGMFPDNQRLELSEMRENALENARRIYPDAPYLLRASAAEASDRYDWSEAESNLLQLLAETNAETVNATRQYGTFLVEVGRLEEALTYIQRAMRLEPRDSFLSFSLALNYLQLGRHEEALEEIARGKAIGDNNNTLNAIEWFVLKDSGDLQGLEISLDNYYAGLAPSEEPIIPESISKRALELMQSVDRETAIAEAMAALATETVQMNRMFYSWVLMHFDEFDRDFTEMDGDITRYLWADLFGQYRQQPAFKELLEERKIVDYWRATGNWADKCQPVEGSDDFECF